MDLYTRLRTRPVLHRAWAKVRVNGLRSESETTKRLTLQFDERWLRNLEKIQRDLKDNQFDFSGEKGIAPAKGKGKKGVRPLVLAPIRNRIVRRAILEVLQGFGDLTVDRRHHWHGVPAVQDIMSTPTSIGGIVGRGVPEALALIDQAVSEGKCWFIRSDIKDFFTRIPKADVNTFIRSAVGQFQFARFFEVALDTNLENSEELEERNLFILFPDPEIGVAQGSALSALAGNIALRTFDSSMNARNIVCIRYIDDFILLGPSKSKVTAAYNSARQILETLGMRVYDIGDMYGLKSGKVSHGNIFDGTDFLGYRISGRSREPSKAARMKFLAKLDAVVDASKQEMMMASKCMSLSHRRRFYQSMVEIHKIVWGWSQSFRHTTANHVFEQLDSEIDRRVRLLQEEARRLIPKGDVDIRRRVMGIHLLGETQLQPLPDIHT